MITSRTDLPWWSDVTRDECGQPMDKLTFQREYEPDYNEALADLAGGLISDNGFADRINRIWLRAAGQLEFDFDLRDLAMFSDQIGGAQ
jgi:hypothetical protein